MHLWTAHTRERETLNQQPALAQNKWLGITLENLVWPNTGLIVGALSWLRYARTGLEGLFLSLVFLTVIKHSSSIGLDQVHG